MRALPEEGGRGAHGGRRPAACWHLYFTARNPHLRANTDRIFVVWIEPKRSNAIRLVRSSDTNVPSRDVAEIMRASEKPHFINALT